MKIRFKHRSGEGTPMTLAIVLALLLIFMGLAEYCRVWIIESGVKEALQQAVISVVNDNYDEVYHAVREGYAAGWVPDGVGWEESVDEGNVYGQLGRILDLSGYGDTYYKYSGSNLEYTISGLDVRLRNNSLASGQSEGFTAVCELNLEVPIYFVGKIFPAANVTVHTEALFMPLF